MVCRIAAEEKTWNQARQKYKTKVYRYTLTDELDAVEEATNSDDFCICRPLSYVGKKATAENARRVYAVAVDVDKIRTGKSGVIGLENLWNGHVNRAKRIPKPTFIVSSGSGLHLYYVLEKPIELYKDSILELQELKRELTQIIWHDTIVNIESIREIQQEGIYQGFRMPGTITKNGGRARAFLTGDRVTVDYLNSFVSDYNKAKTIAERQRRKKSQVKLSEAAEKYPEWYERRIIRREKRGQWALNRQVYDWWKEKIKTGVTVGHRYYCCMVLAIFAKKCGRYDAKHNPNPVTLEELENDLFSMMEPFDKITESEDNHFGADDIQDALEAYEDQWIEYPRAAIEYRTGITIPANKRNGRKREDHIKLMNYIRDELNGNKEWNRKGNGRKSQLETVQAWRQENPEGRKADCIRETGLTKPTVYKHWNECEGINAEVIERKRKETELEETARGILCGQMMVSNALEEARAEILPKYEELLSILPPGEKREKAMQEYLLWLGGKQADMLEALRAYESGEG